jgi:hypothetical protein
MAARVIFGVHIRDTARYAEHRGAAYQKLKAVRDECSSARLVCVEGM